MRKMIWDCNTWSTKEEIYSIKLRNLEYIIKNEIEVDNRLVSEREYDEFEFIGRYYKD